MEWGIRLCSLSNTGVGGYEGDGDITRPDNLEAFMEYVLKHTAGKDDDRGVHFVMADGVRRFSLLAWCVLLLIVRGGVCVCVCNTYVVQGISVEGQENIQEILTKQLVLCQYACALSILREGQSGRVRGGGGDALL